MDTKLATRLPLRVLLTDDNLINQKVASRLLLQLGYQADIAKNGLEAVQALERQAYDLVFMDVQMPVLDGLEATRQIRQKQRETAGNGHFAGRIGIVAMTANAMQGDRDKCIAAGMDDYIPKPVRPEMLQAVIEKLGRTLLMENVARAAAVVAPSAPATTPASPAAPTPSSAATSAEPPVDLARLEEFSGGCADNFNELVGLYFAQTTEQIAQIRLALEAGDLQKAGRVAHSCAGASSTCGMMAIAPILRKLEICAYGGNKDPLPDLLMSIDNEFERIRQYFKSRSS